MAKAVINSTVKTGSVVYCPICSRSITAENVTEVNSGEQDSYIFVHDDVVHDADDIQAIGSGVQ